MKHLVDLLPKRLCHLHVPGLWPVDDEEEDDEEAVAVDELLLLLLLYGGRLLLRKLRLFERWRPPWPLPLLTKLMPSSSSSKAAVKAGVKEGDDAVDGVLEASLELLLETLLMGWDCFSMGLPFRSKKSSAILATSSALICSTSFPIISLYLGGIDLRTCSLRMSSICTSLVSSFN